MTAFDIFLNSLARANSLEGVLGEDNVIYPLDEEFDYSATPLNAVVFGSMGVDGVHYAILTIDGEIREESPVIVIRPMDFDEPYSLLAPTFTDYLARGCAVSREEIEDLLVAEQAGHSSLVEFMRSNFDGTRFFSDGPENDIGPYAKLIIPRPEDEPTDTPPAVVPASAEVARFFPGHDSPERSSDWEAIKSRLSIGSTVRGTVVAQWPIGVLVDIGVGFPALLTNLAFKDAKRRDYSIPIEEYPAVGSIVEARIRQCQDISRTIGLTQAEDDD
jgi:hypothetical protein